MQEIFVDIYNYEGLYKISTFGNVLSLAKSDGNGNKDRLLKLEKVISKKITYYRVSLCKEGKIKRFLVHRLVATHFLNNPENKPQVNHKNNEGTHNKVSNLEWSTEKENMKHSSDQGRQNECRNLGTLKAQQLTTVNANTKFKRLLGNNFQETYTVKTKSITRRFIKFNCGICKYTYTVRSEAKAINRGGVCNSCSKEEDIV